MQTQEGKQESELGFLADSKEWVSGVEKNLITQNQTQVNWGGGKI